jgi:hypothetical protein
MLLHDAERHEKYPCILSSVNATAPRNMKKSRANPSLLRTDVPRSQHNTWVSALVNGTHQCWAVAHNNGLSSLWESDVIS